MGNLYQRANRLQWTAAISLGVMLALSGLKTYGAVQTVRQYEQAETYHAAGRLVEAERLYRQAEAAWGFDYRKEVIRAALEELTPVVQVLESVDSLSRSITAAAAAKDVGGLVKGYNEYQVAKKKYQAAGTAAGERFVGAVEEAKLEAQLADAFSAARAAAEQRLRSMKPAEDAGAAAAELIRIPSVYYGGDAAKRKAVDTLLQARDIARLDALARSKPYLEVWALGEELRQFYVQQGWEAPWVAPKLERLAIGTLTILEKQDLSKFLDASRELRKYEAWVPSGGKADSYIQSVLQQRTASAASLEKSGKYEEAIALYRTLGALTDTSQAIASAERRMLAADPLKLLAGAGAKSKLVSAARLTGRNGSVQAVALNEAGTRLFLAELPSDEGTAPLLMNMTIEPALRTASLRSIEGSDPNGLQLLLAEGASAQRKARFLLMQVKASGLEPLLDLEADGFTLHKNGEIEAIRPAIEGPKKGSSVLRALYRREQDKYVLIHTDLEEKPVPRSMDPEKPDEGKPVARPAAGNASEAPSAKPRPSLP
ncbi:hypothetical protein RAC89_20225 [Paenibacillus sp. GD4]|uniref:hypothetical protein n=1 Tax=Paenibacillus sp. GD4 TaxID=3068890 RepID=UPI002796BF57|nr:hypothetical protein [Paenibacillus sp. GD4]MDQ1912720.1 hypothetical protein [Paenibacillus sp. GD4]